LRSTRSTTGSNLYVGFHSTKHDISWYNFYWTFYDKLQRNCLSSNELMSVDLLRCSAGSNGQVHKTLFDSPHVIRTSVCLAVCSYYISKHQTSKFHQIFYALPEAVSRSSSGGFAICMYCTSSLSVTSCFHTMIHMDQNQRRCVCFV